MVKKKGKPTRGVLRQNKAELKAEHARYFASEDLDFFIEHYWTVRWDLRNKDPYLAETLPYPSIHIVFDKGDSKIYGITKGRFSYLLEGKGSVFGIKFRPGAFYPFFKKHVSLLTGKTLGIDQVFNVNVSQLEIEIFETEEDDDRIPIVESWLKNHIPEKDPNIPYINSIIDKIKEDREVRSVDQIVKLFSIGKRSLQRLFQEYVGVSPKWVIQRYRLHEVAEKIEKSEKVNFAELALDLGYYDQAHFIKDFKNTIGLGPLEYLKTTK
ncbi:helix-turn-helix domain-containing protein [Leptospira ilyithenensis]|uniref:AraC family transcriptional regulator n=1 Tax=Leptospira ilyithenensis TaxID=2484901 RepID=A0A4R9LT29_9LEPT|nr:helix-turn-helix domain-containing protein [Leptospira ilyithenensis]TGN10242.1 AraC family transcriptional regulator [Leptospira ilyithenensis]